MKSNQPSGTATGALRFRCRSRSRPLGRSQNKHCAESAAGICFLYDREPILQWGLGCFARRRHLIRGVRWVSLRTRPAKGLFSRAKPALSRAVQCHRSRDAQRWPVNRRAPSRTSCDGHAHPRHHIRWTLWRDLPRDGRRRYHLGR